MKIPDFMQGAITGLMSAALLGLAWYGVKHYAPPPDDSLSSFSKPIPVLDPPPDYLNIKGERWYLQAYDYKANKLAPQQGTSNCEMRYIWYDSDPKRTAAELREILWHEVIHAAYCYEGNRMKSNWSAYVKDHGEHEIVYEMGMFMPSFAHDNPEFMKWAENWK